VGAALDAALNQVSAAAPPILTYAVPPAVSPVTAVEDAQAPPAPDPPVPAADPAAPLPPPPIASTETIETKSDGIVYVDPDVIKTTFVTVADTESVAVAVSETAEL
jgi:hypothetical protein